MPPADIAAILFLSQLRPQIEFGPAFHHTQNATLDLSFQYYSASDVFYFCDQMAGPEIFQVR